jgi:hypothetical protein
LDDFFLTIFGFEIGALHFLRRQWYSPDLRFSMCSADEDCGMPKESTQLRPSGWVNWCAGRINDPVLRLRFLRAVAPAWQPNPVKARRARGYVVVPLIAIPIAALFLVRGRTHAADASASPAVNFEVPPRSGSGPVPDVWQVEKSGDSEAYSNGLRIDNRFAATNHSRSYRLFPADPERMSEGVAGSLPMGIVFHSTESRQAPFEAQQNRMLKRIGESLLEYVQRKRAYNFLIDRFGRVHRVVEESEAANHAGNSLWSDGKWLYFNLNESFLGISFEAETIPGQVEPQVTPAQLHAAAMLTEMLRSRYGIAGTNCVTHAQVSVNPSNMRIGYHTDWASNFPFAALGLPDNYAQPPAALLVAGFEADLAFFRAAGPPLTASVKLAENRLAERSQSAGLSLRSYRERLQVQYHDRLVALRSAAEDSE